MSALSIIVTNAGRAALVNAQHTGTAPVLIASVGVSPTAIVASAATTAIAGELKRIATLSGQAVADDTIHLVVRDESADSYTMRSFGLYLGDGTLFAVYSQAGPLIEKSVQSMLLLALDIRFVDIAAADLSFGDANFINPAATTEMLGVVELATDAEAETGTDAARAVTPKAMRSAVTSWINSRFGAGAPSAFVKTLLTAASATAMRISLGLGSAATRNEGAGGGLDADLLDGQHGAWYADIPARLSYVPWGPSNDGAGSGLDADTVDGRQAAEFALLTGAAFSGAVSAGTGATGRVTLAIGDANNTGHVEFYTGTGTRRGYIGFVGADGLIRYTSEGKGHLFTGDVGLGVAAQAGYALTIGHDSDLRHGLVVGGTMVGQLQALTSAVRLHAIGDRSVEFWTNGIRRVNVTSLGLTVAGNVNATHALITGGTGGTNGAVRFDRNDGATNMGIIDWVTAGDVLRFANNNGGAFSWVINGTEKMRLSAAGMLAVENNFSARDLTANRGDGTAVVFFGGTGTNHISYSGGSFIFTGGAVYAPGGYLSTGNIVGYNLAADRGNGTGAVFFGPAGSPQHLFWDGSQYLLNGGTLSVPNGNIMTNGALSVAGAIARAGNQVWDAGNDGAGSGLDADLLDGYHAAALLPTGTLASNGYCRLPNGLVMQWVRGAMGQAEEAQTVTFPFVFTTVFDAWVSTSIPASWYDADVSFQLVGSPTKSNCVVQRQWTPNSGVHLTATPVIFAIGMI